MVVLLLHNVVRKERGGGEVSLSLTALVKRREAQIRTAQRNGEREGKREGGGGGGPGCASGLP